MQAWTQNSLDSSFDPTQALVMIHERNLQNLELQKAQFGIQVPISLLNEIDFQKQQLASLRDLSTRQSQTKTMMLLPRRKTNFVDRQTEQTEIRNALSDQQVVLVYGLEGIGKTSLAIQVMWDCSNLFADGTAWYFVQDLTESALLRKVAEDFGAQPGRIGQSYSEVLDGYKRTMMGKNALIAFDNVDSPDQVRDAINWAPQCSFLLTSRNFLDVSISLTFKLPPLDEDAATDLLLKQISDSDIANRNLATEISNQLGRLPLALELAGKLIRSKQFSGLENLANVLEDRMAVKVLGKGEGSVWFSINLTFEKLPQQHKEVLISLSLLCGESIDPEYVNHMWGHDVQDSLNNLILLSLVDREGERLILHPLIREFALENLTNLSQVDTLKQCLTNYFLDFCCKHKLSLDRLRREHCNIVAAIDLAIDNISKFATVLSALDCLYYYLDVDGHWNLIEKWFRSAVQQASAGGEVEIEVRLRHLLAATLIRRGEYDEAKKLLNLNLKIIGEEKSESDSLQLSSDLFQLGNIEFARGKFGKAIKNFEKSLETRIRLSDDRGIAEAKRLIAAVLMHEGHYEECESLLEECEKIYEQLGDVYNVADVASTRGFSAHEQRKLDLAWESYEKYLSIMEQLGDKWGLHSGNHELGRVALAKGDFEAAGQYLEYALKTVEELGDIRGRAATLHEMARLALSTREFDKARSLLEKSTSIRKEVGDNRGLGDNYYQEGRVALAQRRLDEARALFSESLKIRVQINDRRGITAALYWRAKVEELSSQYEQALQSHSEGLEIAKVIGHDFWIGRHLAGLGSVTEKLGQIVDSENHYNQSRLILEQYGLSPNEDDLLLPDI